jgi:RNA polymerase sigma-70 factor (ECF subfamily)
MLNPIRVKYSDEELVEGCRAGKPALQKAFYERFARRMTALCQRYCTDRMEAEDVLHLGFLKIFQKLDTFRGGNLEGWVRQVFVREAIDHYRRRQRQRIDYREDTSDLGNEEVPAEILSTLTMQDLQQLIARLPEGARMVFNLYAIEGYDHAEIANMLTISVGTSKSQLSRARKLLQEKLITLHQS